MPQRRKRKRKPVRIPLPPAAPTLWVLALGNILLGLLLSPVTAAAKVRVVGVPTQDQERVRSVLADLQDRPVLRVNRLTVESRVLEEPALRTVSYRQNLFGRGLLRVSARRPVALLAEGPVVALSEDGRLFQPFNVRGALPKLALPSDALAPSASLLGPWEVMPLAALCQELVRRLPEKEWFVQVDARGVISLKPSATGSVVLGSTRNLDVKLDRLEEALAANPALFERFRELNLTDPSNPVVTELENPE